VSIVRIRVPYRVPYADTDQMGVVYYGNYLTYFERARNELLRTMGLPYSEIEARGFALPVAQAHVDYRAAATYDDELEIHGWVGWLKAVRLRVNCAVYCGDALLAEGYTIHAFVNRNTLRPVRVPDDLAAVFTDAAGDDTEG
jgi:acyl-CoA thioester hydrolase